ncbi:MAG: aminotransferase class I/II-fold pyridoxal phosphate-dependent enzyme, partial [Deltaproteobacteria bacterium]|nr:aminotransferase class I/II-fold pyridoxal phosphate-dependent enzyme [Deltaproteobacteria bacterium]
AELKKQGIAPIDFGVGDPTDPPPDCVIRAVGETAEKRKREGYPSYVGAPEFREAVAGWMKRRFCVSLDPETEICATIGSKEAVFNFHEAIVDPGDCVLCPTPGYPPYKRGTIFAEGIPYMYPLLRKNDFYPDFDSFPDEVLKKTKLLWINYPNSPTGKIADDGFFKRTADFCERHNIIIASDEAYSETYYTKKPRSMLEFRKEGVIMFHSLSKRSNMTQYRVGFVAGDRRLISIFKKLKTNIDSGTATFIQDAAIAALSDETHVDRMREDYRKKMEIMTAAFGKIGCEDCAPEGTIYMWQKAPSGMDGVEFARRLLSPECAVVVTPGAAFSDDLPGIGNPGKDYVRLALVPSLDDTAGAAEKIVRLWGK